MSVPPTSPLSSSPHSKPAGRGPIREADGAKPLRDDRARAWLLHEDKTCLVFNKPPGLAVQGGSGLSENLETIVAHGFGRQGKTPPRLVHRIDRDTSGVLVMAKTKPAAAFYSEAFAERQVKKIYLALVCGGPPEPEQGEIALALRKIRVRGVERVEVVAEGAAGAKPAASRYRTLHAQPGAALLALEPLTGRMHQLRAHCAAIGRPIAGDGKYGGLFALNGAPIPRLMLHAWRLACAQPDGGALAITAPPPADFAAACAAAGLDLDAHIA